MAHLLVIAHAPLASALVQVAGHVFPEEVARITILDVAPDQSASEIEAQLRAAMPAQGELLILTDVFGATPCNVALRVADGARCRVVCGVNVPMLWRTVGSSDEPLDRLVARAVAGATQGVMQLAASRPQNQSNKASSDDPGHPHHQQ
ncbi:MAG: PTS fructose transporter subunit IIA [Rubrivivax sp.]|nr:PTS fructose transporter subunit IIA [Rubrivivax sp.]